eukprot:Amastigsp_a177630_6.p3 type:complete len:134 gc:universal Amastigsp_a177630_6:1925-1524(-)
MTMAPKMSGKKNASVYLELNELSSHSDAKMERSRAKTLNPKSIVLAARGHASSAEPMTPRICKDTIQIEMEGGTARVRNMATDGRFAAAFWLTRATKARAATAMPMRSKISSASSAPEPPFGGHTAQSPLSRT